jgi:heptosyltransferase I
MSKSKTVSTDLDGKRIAVVMMSAIGDSVHVLPVVNALKRRAPGCHLTWVLQPVPASLVRGHAAVDEIVEFDPYQGWRGYLELRRRLAGREFDLVLGLQVAFKAGLVTALLRAPVKLGFDRRRARDANWLFTNLRVPPHAPQHVQDQYFEFLRVLGVPPEPVAWGLGPWPAERERQAAFFAQFERPVAAINIATTNPDRDWLPERWAAVIDHLVERYGLQPVLIGGRSARELACERAIMAAARHRPASALGSGLRPLVGILDGAALVIALDSAPLHISVAVGTPVISLMSNADPRRTGPYRHFRDLVIDAYHDPGESAPISMERRPGRMSRITVDNVLEKIELWQERYRDR